MSNPAGEADDPRPPWLRSAISNPSAATPEPLADPVAAAPPLRVPEGYELRRVHNPRPKSKTHRDDATAPFNSDEWALVAEWAPRFAYSRQPPDSYGAGGRPALNDSAPDPTFAWRTCLVLRGAALHVADLPKLRSSALFEDTSTGWLRVALTRVKNRKVIAPPLLPRADFEPWIRDYLDSPKPATEQAYTYMLDRLSDFIEQSTRTPRPGHTGEFDPGRRVKMNTLRFRHSGLCRWRDEFRFPVGMVCEIGGTTEHTLNRFYHNTDHADTAKRLRGEGVF